MSETSGDDVPRDPWGNPLPPEDRPPAHPRPEDFPPPFPGEPPGGTPVPPADPTRPPTGPGAPPAGDEPTGSGSDNPAWPGGAARRSEPAPPPAAWPGGPPPSAPPPLGPPGPAGTQGQWGQAPAPQWPQGSWGGANPWAPPKNDGQAIGALVCGILGALCGLAGVAGIILGPIAVVLGVTSRRRIQASHGTLRGEGMATTGLVLGAIGTLISVVWIVVLVANPDILQDLVDRMTSTSTTIEGG